MTSTKFLREADTFQVVNAKALNVYDKLPGGNYVVKATPQGALYLQMVEEFTHPKKMYGDNMKRAQRIMDTFAKRGSGTGVLLSGEKGSGKTLLCRTVCIESAKKDMPTIVINAPWAGDNFFSFLSSITQPCIVLFDEFEKVYDTKKNEQDAILTLLDGVWPSKKLFMLTCNDRHGINTNMINRPGRIFYSLEFRGLDENFIRDYSQDNLKNKDHVESVVRITHLFSEFNFDMLQALIEEMNRYQETPAEALTMLNVSPVYDYANYKVNVLLGSGEAIVTRHTSPNEVRSPMAMKDGIKIRVYTENPKYDPKLDEDEYEQYTQHDLMFHTANILSITGDNMILKNKDGDVLTLTKEKPTLYNWRNSVNGVDAGAL